MNKTLIILLVAIVAVNAFVKRDAPKPAEGEKDIGDQLKELGQKISEAASKTFNPENMQKEFNKALDSISETINSLKEKANAPKS